MNFSRITLTFIKKMGAIYKITSPALKIYVGQTINYKERLKRYKWLNCEKQRMLFFSLKKYGFDKHVFEILEDDLPIELLNEREKYWIKECNSYYKNNRANGMNLNTGGNTPVWDSIRIKSFSDKFKGKNNPFFGKTHSKETRELYSRNATKQMQTQKPTRQAIEAGANKVKRAIVVYNIDGTIYNEFDSLTSCANHFAIDRTSVRDSLNGCRIQRKYKCEYKIAI